MKLNKFVLPIGVLSGAALLLLPSESRAWTFIGGSLNLGQRDVRVFNNFTDPTANNNTAAHVNFPGALGAPMALWKGAQEWSSEPMGTGSGDPTQLAVGSGGLTLGGGYTWRQGPINQFPTYIQRFVQQVDDPVRVDLFAGYKTKLLGRATNVRVNWQNATNADYRDRRGYFVQPSTLQLTAEMRF